MNKLLNAYLSGWKNIFNYKDKFTSYEYLAFLVPNLLFIIAVEGIRTIIEDKTISSIIFYMGFPFMIAMVLTVARQKSCENKGIFERTFKYNDVNTENKNTDEQKYASIASHLNKK